MRERGSAFLWVFIIMILGVMVVTASLVIARQNVRDQVITLERADGLAYASMAGEIAVAVVRENTGFDRVYVGPTTLSGQLNPFGSLMNYVVDLRDFDADTRSLRVTVTPEGGNRPFVAVARLREDLSVGDWLVVDYDAAPVSVVAPSLPKFASCEAAFPRVLGAGQQPQGSYDNQIRWSYANAVTPDRIVITWNDFLAGTQMKEVANTLRTPALAAAVTTPFPRPNGIFYPPTSVPYLLEMFFEGRVVDSCVVEVTSGRFEFLLIQPEPTDKLCFEGDTAVVIWRFNVDQGNSIVPTVLVGARRTDGATITLTRDDRNKPSGTREFALPSGIENKFIVRAEAPNSIIPMVHEFVIDVENTPNVAPCYLLPPATIPGN